MHAEAVLLVDHHEREVAERDRLLEQRVRADQNVDVAVLRARRESRRARAPFRGPVSSATRKPAGCGEALDGLQVLAGQQLGRRHQRGLRAGLDRRRHGEQRHHRLAAADIALQQPQHAVRAGEIRIDLGKRALLRACELEGKAGDDLPPELAGGRKPAPGAPAEPGADDGERQLIGEELVIGEPLAVTGRKPPSPPPLSGACRRRSACGEVRPGLLLAEIRIDPFRQPRDALERLGDALRSWCW